MNNNDILNALNTSGNGLELPESLNPSAVEDSLSTVKRKSNKGVVSACVTLGAVCLTVATVFLFQSFKTSPYDDVYDKVVAVRKANRISLFDGVYEYFSSGAEYKDESSVMEDVGSSIYTSGSLGSGMTDYSDTNVQVDGVDEADFTKTDGRYIYSVSDESIYITNPNDGKPMLVSEIKTGYDINDLYIHENKIVAIADGIDKTDRKSTADSVSKIEGYGTSVLVYDVSDVTSPELVSILGQTGDCVSTRKIDNVVYLVTNYGVNNLRKIVKDKPETYCPRYSTNDEVSCIPAENISICENVDRVEYVTVASIDLNNPQSFADMQSVLGGGENVYSSLENIYIASYSWDSGTKTEILRFSVDGTTINENGSLMVDGSILNQFSMDEYNGCFRVVTEKTNEVDYGEYVSMSINDRTTSLYVFDDDLNQIGKTGDLAKGETVKSVRFDGDIAYFVTFRQTDPLFTVDLSDPSEPKVLSELKIPGFSEYLHVMSDDLLLGFGRDADEFTGFEEGMKLTMFDTSDKTNVYEKATIQFASESEYSEAEYNHKAVYVDEDEFIVGVPYWSLDNLDGIYYSFFKFDVDSNEFVEIKTIAEDTSADTYFDYGRFIRGMRIGDEFYLVTDDGVYAYEYQSFEKTGNLKF